jgi:hypothetical protein
VLPYSTLIGVPASSDELALSIWWRLQDNTISSDHVATWVVVASIIAATLFLVVPRRRAALLPAAVLACFATVTWTAMDNVHGFRISTIGALFQGITNTRRDWIDRAVGHDANVAVLWATCRSEQCPQPRSLTDEKVVWENEFFSRSVREVYVLHDPMPGGLPERPASFHLRSGFFTSGGHPIRAGYALVDTSVEPVGHLVARDRRKGVAVYRLAGPLRQAELVNGIYPDTWSAPHVLYVRRGCTGGTLTAVLQGDASLVRRTQTVAARVLGGRARSVSVRPGSQRTFVVPLPRRSICRVDFDVSPSAVPGAGDRRRLGIHFLSLRYARPAS